MERHPGGMVRERLCSMDGRYGCAGVPVRRELARLDVTTRARLDATWGRRRTCKSDVRESRRPARLRTFCPFSGVYGHFLFFPFLYGPSLKKLKDRLQKMTMRNYSASVIVAPTEAGRRTDGHEFFSTALHPSC